MAKDRQYRKLINSKEWRQLRRQKLNAKPLCENCLRSGVLRSATEVHHIRPVESGANPLEKERLMFQWDNLRSLCHDCHKAAHMSLHSHDRKVMAARRRAATKAASERLFGPLPEGARAISDDRVRGKGGLFLSMPPSVAEPDPPHEKNEK